MPLYRQEQISQRYGVALSRQTMAHWIGLHGHALMPLAQELQKLLLQSSVLHADETPIKQLTYKNKAIVEDAKTAYLWAYCTSDIDSQGPPIILFDYQPGRHGEHAKQFLENYSGNLMVDDYAGCKNFLKGTHTLLNWVAWCTPIAKNALDFFACLYQIEGKAKEASVQERTGIRQKHAVPVLEAMKKWLDEQALVVKSEKILNAISYILKRWASLVRYAQDVSLPIDNNPVKTTYDPLR